MIQHDFHANKFWSGLALHRFHIHLEEVKRELMPILQEVYQIGYDRGVADSYHSLSLTPHTENIKEENNDMPEVPATEPVSDGMPSHEDSVLPEMSSENSLGTEG